MADPWAEFRAQQQPKADPWAEFRSSAPATVQSSMAAPGGSMAWGDVAGQALSNLGSSAEQFGKDIAYPFMHPAETIESLSNLGLGAIEKVIPGEQKHEQYADALGEFFMERYGGMENLKRTMATDPIGFLADASTLLTGGSAALARTPMAATKVGRATQALAHPVKTTGKAAAELVGSLGTHTGGQSLRTAAAAGRKGGAAAKAFRGAVAGTTSMDEVVGDARRAVAKLRARRGAAYRSGMAKVAKDTTVLDFTPIDRALAQAGGVKKYKGITINKSTGKVQQQIDEVVNLWKSLDPAEYHTPEGLDALKQAIGDIRDSTEFGTPSRVVADQTYNAVKDQIVRQAPEYADVMKDYWQASDLIKDVEKTLSLNPKASIDTSLRKLQSVMRNNVNTNYGRRLALADMLVDAGAENLMEKLAGQSLTTWSSRGLGKLQMGGSAALALALDPTFWATLPFQSPRIMGEAAYRLGQTSKLAPPAGTSATAFQTGRASRE